MPTTQQSQTMRCGIIYKRDKLEKNRSMPWRDSARFRGINVLTSDQFRQIKKVHKLSSFLNVQVNLFLDIPSCITCNSHLQVVPNKMKCDFRVGLFF